MIMAGGFYKLIVNFTRRNKDQIKTQPGIFDFFFLLIIFLIDTCNPSGKNGDCFGKRRSAESDGTNFVGCAGKTAKVHFPGTGTDTPKGDVGNTGGRNNVYRFVVCVVGRKNRAFKKQVCESIRFILPARLTLL